MLQRAMRDAETVSTRKRIYFLIEAADGSAWAGSVTGVKAKLSLSGATEVDSTNDIVRLGGYWHYVELTNTEAAAGSGGDVYLSRVPSASGRLESPGVLEITPDDPYAASLTDVQIADAFLDRDMATGTDSGSSTVRTVRQALRALRNRFTVSGGTATFYKEDDSTTSHTAVVTGTPAVTEANPAGGS